MWFERAAQNELNKKKREREKRESSLGTEKFFSVEDTCALGDRERERERERVREG